MKTSCVPSSLRSVIFPSAIDSSVPSEPRTTTRGGEFFTATKLVSMVTDTPVSVERSAVNAVLCRAGVHRAVGVGALGDLGAQSCTRVDEIAEGPEEEVDDVGAPRADPSAAALAVEQPAVGAHRDAEAGTEHGPLDVLDGPDGAVLQQGAQRDASGVVPELEVEERDRVGVTRRGFHRLGVGGRRAERLVAEHGLARVECGGDTSRVEERGSVHRDEVDVGVFAESRAPRRRHAAR